MNMIGIGAAVWLLAGALTAHAQYNPELGEVGDNQLSEVTPIEEEAKDKKRSRAPRTPAETTGIDYGGSLRVGLESTFFSFVTTSADREGTTTDESTMRFGIIPSELGINVGYAFLDQLVLGARVQSSVFSYSHNREGADSDTSGFGLSFRPYCEYVLSPGDDIEWLVYGTLGIQTRSSSADGASASQLDFALGAGGGAHVVLSDLVSIDPVAEIGYAIGSLSEPAREFDLSTLVVSVRAGISLWL